VLPVERQLPNKRAILVVMCTRCVPGPKLWIFPGQAAWCPYSAPTEFEPALPRPEGGTCVRWLVVMTVGAIVSSAI